MITASLSGLGEFCARRIAQLKSIATPTNDQDKIMRTVALTMQAKLHHRIHEEGKASDDSQIGQYSKGYIAVRTGQFKSNGKVTKGKSKGETRDKGTFTKGVLKGQPRPKFNRSNDKKVVISLTKKLELSYATIATNNGYGIGFIDASVDFENYNNSLSSIDKAHFVEETYKKKIFSLTKEEKAEAIRIADFEVKKRLNVH